MKNFTHKNMTFLTKVISRYCIGFVVIKYELFLYVIFTNWLLQTYWYIINVFFFLLSDHQWVIETDGKYGFD